MVYQQMSVTHHTWTGNDVSWTVSDASRSVDASGAQSSDVEKGKPTGPGAHFERVTPDEIVSSQSGEDRFYFCIFVRIFSAQRM